MTWFAKPYADAVQRMRVPIGFLGATALAVFSRPDGRSLAAGIPLCLLGLWLRTWAAGHLRKNQALTRSGPYGWVRNPLYAGSLLLAAGFVVAGGAPWLGLLFAAVFALVYLPVIEQEEQHLRTLFPEYAAYAEQVPLLVPRRRLAVDGDFSWSQWKVNEEWKAVGATALGYALLWLKAVTW